MISVIDSSGRRKENFPERREYWQKKGEKPTMYMAYIVMWLKHGNMKEGGKSVGRQIIKIYA